MKSIIKKKNSKNLPAHAERSHYSVSIKYTQSYIHISPLVRYPKLMAFLSILDFDDMLFDYKYLFRRSDAEAMAGDWEKIGRDLRRSIELSK